MLYTSENSSLAYLETLVHFNNAEFPPYLHITPINIDKSAQVFELPDDQYPLNWMEVGNPDCTLLGDEWMTQQKYLAIRVRSAINNAEYNYLLNPLHPKFNKLVKVTGTELIHVDTRLINF